MKYLILIAMFVNTSYSTVIRGFLASNRLIEETPAENISLIEHRAIDSFVPVPHLSCDNPDIENIDIANCLYNQQHVWIRAI